MVSLMIRGLAIMALMAVAVPLMPGFGPGPAAADVYAYDYSISPNWLEQGWSLGHGVAIASCCYTLHVQKDCNLVLYPIGHLDKPMWASNTAGTASDCNLFMQDDCNAVLYETGTQKALWASHTAGQGSNCELWLQNDGNVVIYGGDKASKWSTQTQVQP